MENTLYPIPDSLIKSANISKDKYEKIYHDSITNPEKFWGELAMDFLTWNKKWESVKNTNFSKDSVDIKWFEGGKLNISENCVDRHLDKLSNKPAIIFEPDDPGKPVRILTYKELHVEVCKLANALEVLGIKHGDRVTIYMPMIPEAAISMLACARIGAIHSVVFAGFSPLALNGRILDSDSKIVITADQGLRGGKLVNLKQNVDEAIRETNIEKVLVFKNTGTPVDWNNNIDIWWHDLEKTVSSNHKLQYFDSENPLFILYTSGSTGKPKGLLHSSAGYLLYAATTFNYVFDYKDNDVYWCTADVGWITGHSYIVYGPLCNGATTLMYEGVPSYPDASRFWQIIDKHKVSLFYTSPTAIRALLGEGNEFLSSTSRNTLRVLGSVGEPINREAWIWYYEKVGKSNCAIVDTWWQTETGGHMITPLPYAIRAKAGSATLPFFGIQPAIVSVDNKEINSPEEVGALCIKNSWPGQARTIWRDHKKFIETYFSSYPGTYFSGDAAKKDEDGYFWIQGRMDDVINVSGHRISTAEVESAINFHEMVAESAVVGFPHEVKGEALYVYIILKSCGSNNYDLDNLTAEIKTNIRSIIGGLAVPDKMQFVSNLPKTRSGKIMRRVLRKIAAGEIKNKEDYVKLGDISTLLNPEGIDELVKGYVN